MCGKVLIRLARSLGWGRQGKFLVDFTSDGELGLHHSLLKQYLRAETRDFKKDKERNKLEETTGG